MLSVCPVGRSISAGCAAVDVVTPGTIEVSNGALLGDPEEAKGRAN